MPCSTPIVDSSHVFLINNKPGRIADNPGVQSRSDWIGRGNLDFSLSSNRSWSLEKLFMAGWHPWHPFKSVE